MSSVGELGERDVLARVLAQLNPADAAILGPGDDCAVLSVSGELVVTSDTMIEGPDFRRAWHSGFDLGWKLAATNLSDVAAMGARPIGLTVSLAVPRDTPVNLLEEIARGLTAACAELAPGCGVVGGDLGRAPVVTAAVTALGDLQGRAAIKRAGAKPGDVIAYAGDLGLAGLGLSLLFSGLTDADGTAHDRGLVSLRNQHPAVMSAQLAPSPPIALGITAAEAGATAMMDVSDSLSIDAARIGRASSVVLDLDSSLLEQEFGLQGRPDALVRVPIEAMLTGGEDHGMLATFPERTLLPDGFKHIGVVREAASPTSDVDGGVFVNGSPFQARGWDPYTVRLPGAD